jgi:hypothetical protein
MRTTEQPSPTSEPRPPTPHGVRRSILNIVGRGSHEGPGRDRGVEANARLTATTGLLLLIMLAAEGVTLVSIHGLISWHIAIGLALIPPVTLKLGSTMWRFAHYYLGDRRYTAAGPPHPLLRILGPLLVLSTVALLATGVALWLQGRNSAFGFWHKASFIVWVALMTIHVLAHLVRAVRLAGADVGPRRIRQAASSRPLLRQTTVLASMVAGVILAVAAKGAAGGLGQWSHDGQFFH